MLDSKIKLIYLSSRHQKPLKKEPHMKPVFWLQFLKETIPDNRTRRQLQRHLNQHLITPTLSDRHAAKQNRGGLS